MIKDRQEAGRLLADKIGYIDRDALILAIPRGGVLVADFIAKQFGCNLDVIISKKITPVDCPEFAVGAITHDGTLYKGEYWDKFSSEAGFDEELRKKRQEAERRIRDYRGAESYDLGNKTVVLVDDGVATGNTVYALLNWLRKQDAKEIILAVPVIPFSTFEKMKNLVARTVCIETPHDFSAVGRFYENFYQVSDEEVKNILRKYSAS